MFVIYFVFINAWFREKERERGGGALFFNKKHVAINKRESNNKNNNFNLVELNITMIFHVTNQSF